MKFDQNGPIGSQQPGASSQIGQPRRTGSRGLNQFSDKLSYQPSGIGAHMSGQSFYKAGNDEQDSIAQLEKMPGQYKKLKVNADYLQRPEKKRNDVSQEKEKN